MKFEKSNVIVLGENDEIKIKLPNRCEAITIKSDGKNIDISGGSELIGSIKGTGMLEKVDIPPVISSLDIIEKCDKWLEMFRKIHDKFRELVLTDEYREQNVVMKLSFSSFFSFEDSNIKGRTIDLDLKQYSTIIQKGVTISIDEANEDVYAYLVANVLDYYVSKNYKGTKINNMSMHFNDILYSNESKDKETVVPMLAGICSLMESSELSRVVNSILGAHNLGVSSKQIIANLRNRISNQQVGDRIDSGISYTERQFEYVINGNEGKVPVKTLTRKI